MKIHPKKPSIFFPQLPFSVRSAYSLFRLILVFFLRESMNMVQFARQSQCVVRVGLRNRCILGDSHRLIPDLAHQLGGKYILRTPCETPASVWFKGATLQ